MTALDIPEYPLPTLDRLGVPSSSLLTSIDSTAIASSWLSSFSDAASASPPSVPGILSLMLPDAFWRDMLALTWDIRTFAGHDKIRTFLEDRLALSKVRAFKLKGDFPPKLDRPFEDVAWISFMFEFETDVGAASAVVRLVPLPLPGEQDLQWKAHVVFTNLEFLLAFPPKVGPRRNSQPNHSNWATQREREIDFSGADPKVLIIGAGQCGLAIAARLKVLDVPSLVVERNPKVGDNWRRRYGALCLHDPVWSHHLPYLPFPANWPVYPPALKLANWLEFYAEALELNIWTSSTITSVRQDPATNKWNVEIKRGDGTERKFTINHVIFCTGLGGGIPNIPPYPGMEKFKGQILHSSEHSRATDHAGKSVVVVGTCSSAHGIAVDYYRHNVDVTMFQRGSTYVMSIANAWPILYGSTYWEDGPPVDIVDRLAASFPVHMAVPVQQRAVKYIAELDKELLESLHKIGFRTNLGIKDTGVGLLSLSKRGGFYLDNGGSQLIAEGKIKLKSDSQIESFTETGIKFENGTELAADVVVFATGFGDPKGTIRRVCGAEIADRMNPIDGLDEEGEINGLWRHSGVQGLWCMVGNLVQCRFHSNHIALQIKAMEEGIFGMRYKQEQQGY